MREPNWMPLRAVIAIHRELIDEHGGLLGPPRLPQLESVLARPRQLLVYAEEVPSVPRLAASLGHGLAKGHCFPDGNKRIALAAIDVFLQLNGLELTASEEDAVLAILALSSGELDETGLAEWISAQSAPIPDDMD